MKWTCLKGKRKCLNVKQRAYSKGGNPWMLVNCVGCRRLNAKQTPFNQWWEGKRRTRLSGRTNFKWWEGNESDLLDYFKSNWTSLHTSKGLQKSKSFRKQWIPQGHMSLEKWQPLLSVIKYNQSIIIIQKSHSTAISHVLQLPLFHGAFYSKTHWTW